MEISVTPQEVAQFARNLHQWGQQVRQVQRDLLTGTSRLQSHWNDPQFQLFTTVIQEHGKNLELATVSLEELSRTLQKMSQDMDEHIKRQRQMVDAMRRR